MAQFAAAESYWSSFPETYRAEQIATIARWIAIGDSGVVIGGSGTGKSNIAGYINARGDVMAQRLPAQIESCCFLHVDVNSLPVVTSASFYRAMLQSLCLNGSELVPQLSDELLALLRKIPAGDDSLALYFSLLRAHQLLIQRAGKRVIWLIDRFEEMISQPGLDAVIVGPRDLSLNMGFKDGPTHPEVQSMIEWAVAICKKANVAAGITAGTRANAENEISRGMTMILGIAQTLVLAGSKDFLPEKSHYGKTSI